MRRRTAPGAKYRWWSLAAAGPALLVVVLALVLVLGRQVRYAIVSDDRTLELDVPADALPDGLAPEALRVTKLDRAAFTRDDQDVLAVYRMEPDGLAFKKPVLFRTTQGVGARLPTAVTASRDGVVEPVRDLNVTIDTREGTATIRGQIAHFSDLWIQYSFFRISINDPTLHLVGDPVQARAEIDRFVDRQNIDLSDNVFAQDDLKDHWTVRGAMSFLGDGLTPLRFEDTPPATAVATKTFTVQRTFTCVRVGSAALRWEIELTYEAHRSFHPNGTLVGVAVTLLESDLDYTVTTHYAISSESFLCDRRPDAGAVATPPTPSPISTTTSRTPTPSAAPPLSFRSFNATFLPDISTTAYTVAIDDPTGARLLYYWSIRASCGGLAAPQQHSEQNGYVHAGCDVNTVERAAVASVRIVRAADVVDQATGAVRPGGVVATYVRSARARDSDETAGWALNEAFTSGAGP